ncbi:MAG TPA: EAL domain-containing protein [Burkholderiaceae bacterium]
MQGDSVAASSGAPLESQFLPRRVRQMLLMALCAMCLSAAASVFRHRLDDAVLLLFGAVLLMAAWMIGRRGRIEYAVALMLGTVTLIITALIWRNNGLRDIALLAYPGILLLASMLGTRWLLLTLFTFMMGFVALVVAGNEMGWHVNRVVPTTYSNFFDVLGILGVTAACGWVVSRDLRQTLRLLQAENQRVRDSQERIAYIAGHDALTGLANRSLARDRFEHALAHARRNRTRLGLLYLDLDDFKTVNDSQGHPAGDELLQQVARRLTQALRAADTVCRLGGDEFLILLDELPDNDDAAEVAGKLLAELSQPFELQGLEVAVSCSIGIALFPEDGGDFDVLLKRADTAMYRAKDDGRNTYRYFDAAMNAGVLEHVQLAAAMRTALARDEFVLHYQPQFDLESGRIIGAEALIRWQHRELGLVPPGRFIPVAERSGLIVPIGAWVLEQACKQAMQWQAQGLPELVMSVNVSPVQFRRGDIEHVVMQALADSGLAAAKLELELTESLLIHDSSSLVESLARLRQLGVGFAIDDFGTGYSNLGYLRRFEVERLKIDQSFVRRMHDQVDDQAIVRAIVQIADSLGLITIAEGVEDEATLIRLLALGCDEAQGYLWSKPLPADEFLAFALAHSVESITALRRA